MSNITPGWFKEQVALAESDVAKWPDWLKRSYEAAKVSEQPATDEKGQPLTFWGGMAQAKPDKLPVEESLYAFRKRIFVRCSPNVTPQEYMKALDDRSYIHPDSEAATPKRESSQPDDCRESQMVTLERDKEGKPTVWCDIEIAPVVKYLNDNAVKTIGSCSGHGHLPPTIILADGRCAIIAKNVDEMNKMIDVFGINIAGETKRESSQPVDKRLYQFGELNMLFADTECKTPHDAVEALLSHGYEIVRAPKRESGCVHCNAKIRREVLGDPMEAVSFKEKNNG